MDKRKYKKSSSYKRGDNRSEKFRILTFDGGGVRGALSISLLERLNDSYPKLIDKTNMIGGTSTGSFIALALAYGISVDEIRTMYSFENSKSIFTPSHSELVRPKYENKNLRKLLEDIFPIDLKLKDLKKTVIIPSFFIGDKESSWEVVFFNNIPNSPTEDARVIDVALASSATPIYFPSYRNHIDGGVVAIDPSLSCIVHAIDEHIGKTYSDITMLSIGTGYSTDGIKVNTKDWGLMDWVTSKNPSYPIVSLGIEGNSQVSQLFTKKLLKERYYRLNPELLRNVSLDDYEEIDYLISLGENYDLDKTVEWLRDSWK